MAQSSSIGCPREGGNGFGTCDAAHPRWVPPPIATLRAALGWVDTRPPRSAMNIVIFIIVAAVLIVGAVMLGMKFFSTSVKQEEHEKGWDE